MRNYNENNFPQSGSHEVYELKSEFFIKELEKFDNDKKTRHGWNVDWELEKRLQEEALTKLYGNVIETFEFPTEQDLPSLVKTDKGNLILKYADADSGGYDVAEYWHILYGREKEEFIKELLKFFS